jgi:hypothetical protein
VRSLALKRWTEVTMALSGEFLGRFSSTLGEEASFYDTHGERKLERKYMQQKAPKVCPCFAASSWGSIFPLPFKPFIKVPGCARL